MAIGGTAPPLIMASHTHALLDQDSTVSSPLSSPQAEGHDAEHDDLDLKSTPSDDDELQKSTKPLPDSPANASHEESDLSDLETNDSEAETERLYDTPRKLHPQSTAAASFADAQHKESEKQPRALQTSPIKLQGSLQGGIEPDSGEDDNNEPPHSLRIDSGDPLLARKRKRSRSVLIDPLDPKEPPRKRSGSVLTSKDDSSSLSKPTESTGDKSAEGFGDDDDSENAATKDAGVDVKVAPVRAKSKRSQAKKRKDLDARSLESAQDAGSRLLDEGQPAEEEPVVTAEIDEETRHEEELEKKRHAFGQLAAIEKQFAILRDRLYEERLKELNEEEASLTRDTPTHPEYVAMIECIDSRRDDRLARSEVEFKFEVDAVNRWAVARRAQIFSQYHQSVRESRERTMDGLGKQWYEIQHERRKMANPIPDYGFRFPKDKAQQIKQAIAHNKETSILAGVAQHHGFPAAPEMKAASRVEIEDDFEAMNRARRSMTAPTQHRPPALNDYGNVPFGQSLGPAGEQFLEQTPWANPRHPSHHHAGAQRQLNTAYNGPPAFSQQSKPIPQSAGAAWLANGQPHGDYTRKYLAAADQDVGPARNTVDAPRTKYEAVLL